MFKPRDTTKTHLLSFLFIYPENSANVPDTKGPKVFYKLPWSKMPPSKGGAVQKGEAGKL